MLAACLEVNPSAQVSGMEIEPWAWQGACRTLPGPAQSGSLVHGNAFSSRTLARLPSTSLDLVITNPPYVRYQSQVGVSPDGLPSALEVRTGLLEALCDKRLFCHLLPYERDLLRELAQGYSGFADLAVPAWLLCAALTQPSGVLAMVVPEAWLSRDYARVVQCMLLRLFRLQLVIDDAHASWFADAAIRTTLVVAERVAARPSCAGWGTATFLRADVQGNAQARGSLVGDAWPDSCEPERQFAAALSSSNPAMGPRAGHGWRAVPHLLENMAQDVVLAARGQAWATVGLGNLLRPIAGAVPSFHPVPQQLADWLGPGWHGRLGSLESAGFSLGQGLRTGSNDFFHVDLVDEGEMESTVQTKGGSVVTVPTSCLLRVVRNQSELDGSPVLRHDGNTARLLWLEGWALPEDAERATQAAFLGPAPLRVLPARLAAWIRGQARAGVSGMSAVKTNARVGRNGIPRWWYTLPPLAPRHRPDLLVPRVNGGSPLPTLNTDRRFIVDANFSSIWTETHPDRVAALLALLATAWCGAALEHLASVMGGGALKVEAAHLRRLPIPALDDDQWTRFGRLGQELAVAGWSEALAARADSLLVQSLLGNDDVESRVQSLRAIRHHRVRRRCARTWVEEPQQV